jgi:hypothetical protein
MLRPDSGKRIFRRASIWPAAGQLVSWIGCNGDNALILLMTTGGIWIETQVSRRRTCRRL